MGVSGAGKVGTAISSAGGVGDSGAGMLGFGAGVAMVSSEVRNGPIGSLSSPVSPSGIDDGAATGSEKTGSILVLLVISSIAFCRSLSTV